MMRVAVVADVHSNLAALEAVLESLRDEACDAAFYLGDVVGYYTRPRECLELVSDRFDHIVAGNHDRDVCRGKSVPGTNSAARIMQEWTFDELSESEKEQLSDWPSRITSELGIVAVHGCYLNTTHVSGYVTSTMLEMNLRAVADHDEWPKIALCGHTHVPMCGWLVGDECRSTSMQEDTHWDRDADAVLVNPGAVGQPRDGDPRAAYAVIDLDRRLVLPRRVEYPIEQAADHLQRLGLPQDLAARLREGR